MYSAFNKKYIKYKFVQDLKAIYITSDEEIGKKLMYEVAERWKEKYPTAMERWEENWGIIYEGRI